MNPMAFRKTYEEAIEAARLRPAKPRTPMSRGKRGFTAPVATPSGDTPVSTSKREKTALVRIPLKRRQRDPELAAWGRRVRERDGNSCQYRERSGHFCQSGDRRIDPHHVAPRGRRPDLIYVDANGICLCRLHHDWVHDNPIQAEAMALLSSETYEKAMKEPRA